MNHCRLVVTYKIASKLGTCGLPRTSPSDIWLLGGRCSAFRWRELVLGFFRELREPVVSMAKEKSKWQTHKGESTDARHWGGPTRKSDEGR